MTINKTLQAGLFALCLATSAEAGARTVDVARHALPPLPTTEHVRVVNSDEHRIRHHGVRGAFERLHRWHMRERAKIYRHWMSR